MIIMRLFFRRSFVWTAAVVLCATASLGCGSSRSGKSLNLTDEELALMEQQRWADGNIPIAQRNGLFQDILFEYNSSRLSPSAQEQVRQNAEVMINDPSLRVEIEGHCDKRGTSEYNLALGEQRARSVASLMASYGVNAAYITAVSYGEEIPIDLGDTDESYAMNRRVHFALFRAKPDEAK